MRGVRLTILLSDDEATVLATFAATLRVSPHNLLSARGLLEVETRHIPESAAFARSLPTAGRILDVGSGGGLPGIVIAVLRRECDVHLLEATGKKAAFLTAAVAELGLAVEVHHGRAEDLARGPLAASFDIVTARAVAPLSRLATWCAPYLRVGGQLHAIKGERWVAELAEARSTIAAAGLHVIATPEDRQEDADEHMPRVVVLERRR
jgi:16S rRNA (guanine527-N7)-methyltransferase